MGEEPPVFVNNQAKLKKSYYHSQGQSTRKASAPLPSSESPGKCLSELQIISNFLSQWLVCGGAAKT